MLDQEEAKQLLLTQGHFLSGDGVDFGPVTRVYLDEYTNWPSFATITQPGSLHQPGSPTQRSSGLIFDVKYSEIFSFQGLITAVIGALIVLIIYGFIRRRTTRS